VGHVDGEIASQPGCWQRAIALAAEPETVAALPSPGERVAVVGCGTSWFMAMCYAGLREAAGQGETDAFAASEFPVGRRYDRIVAITRSGTTTEVLRLIDEVDAPTTALIGDPATPAVTAATHAVLLPFADERSVVQTRFATSALTLLRASLGTGAAGSDPANAGLTGPVAEAAAAVDAPLPLDPAGTEQVTFLGRGWTLGLAHEAALKCREAAVFWAESYPALDYRHGPISIAAPGRAVWAFGELPDGLPEQIRSTGATLVECDRDPVAQLILAQRFAVAKAASRGLDPDQPRHLTRSVILT
jgi:fructoselysine-6-P-deglycase FrlB-like protein